MKLSGLRETHSLPDSIRQRLNIAPKSLGICPECGTEQTEGFDCPKCLLSDFVAVSSRGRHPSWASDSGALGIQGTTDDRPSKAWPRCTAPGAEAVGQL
jgi:hypothetical protein